MPDAVCPTRRSVLTKRAWWLKDVCVSVYEDARFHEYFRLEFRSCGRSEGSVALFERLARWAGVMAFGQIEVASSLNAAATRS
jgi:hypothetical protein